MRASYPHYHPALRIAVLTPDLSLRQIARKTRRCRVVAASVPVLRWLSQAIETGALVLPPSQAAVVAFTGVRHDELTELERDRFWRVFQAPVFEQLLSPEGRILAMECDAHDGLHVLDQQAPLIGLRAFLDRTPCGCGNRHPRLKRIQMLDQTPGPPPLRGATSARVEPDESEKVHDKVRPIDAPSRVA